MKLISTTLYSGLITIVKTTAAFVSTKIVAMFVGAAGVATIGAFGNFLNIVLAFANGAIQTGVVKYTAEYQDDVEKSKKLFSTSFRISVLCSLAIGALLLALSNWLSTLIFATSQYGTIVRVLGVTIVFYALNSLLISVLNGKGLIKIYSIVNMAGSLLGLVLTCVLVYFFQIEGALLALILSQTAIFFVSLFIVYKKKLIVHEIKWSLYDRDIAKKLSGYSLMAIVSAMTVPVAQILIRNMLTVNMGIDSAGIWQGMIRVSDAYLLIINTALGTYYLPKLSTLIDREDITRELYKGFKLIMPLVVVSCLIMYVLRFFVIRILYTPEFYIMEELFLWQLLGDIFKIAAFLLAYLMLAKALTKVYIITEIIFSVLYVVLSYIMIPIYGVKGATLAFFFNYIGYFVFMSIYFKDYLFRNGRV
ncbi:MULTISPECIES: O-antigen translocase [Myroides]|uniref:Oligosaccharide flippase family protein n=1 Tax=Myroides albus TaxID=2562892 RepID=A0A6I3LLJ4_9FLAO|nr:MULTISPECIES: O-antigen translocase [Myroides]MTG98724.1 oligosaccharide flippase family protein [Myroides albus]MVX37139.1 oligosaccharide flippase family protein [Myroides sp. LoEW2-1]UVD79077.1 O-antigen translocase [Myroides albus]